MKCLASRAGLLAALELAAGVAPARSAQPILVNLLLNVGDESTLLATDLEVGITARVLGLKAEAPGKAVLPAGRFQAILKSLSDEELAVETEGDNLVARGRNAEFTLATEAPDLFPDVPGFEAESYLVVAAADLRKAIRRTAYATDPDSTRYALGGCLFQFAAGMLVVVATDGGHLAMQSVPAEVEGTLAEIAENTVLPLKALKLLGRLLKDDDPPAHLAVAAKRNATIRTETAVLFTRLVEGRFPRHEDVFPKSPAVAALDVTAAVLRDALAQADVIASKDTNGVTCSLDGARGLLTLSAASEAGTAHVESPVDYNGPAVSLTFDPRKLGAMLKSCDGPTLLSLSYYGPGNAVVFRAADGFTYAIMPIVKDDK